MYTVDKLRFNSGFYLLDKDISAITYDKNKISIRKGTIVYAETRGMVDLVRISPRDADYFERIDLMASKAMSILKKTPDIIRLEGEMSAKLKKIRDAGLFKRLTREYQETVDEIERIKNEIFDLEQNTNSLQSNEASFPGGRSICISKKSPYSLTTTPPGVILNLESMTGFAIGDTFSLFGQEWNILSKTQAYARLPEGSSGGMSVLLELPAASEDTESDDKGPEVKEEQ